MNITDNIEFADLSFRGVERPVRPPSPWPKPGTRLGRIVTLAPLSRTIPDRLIGHGLARYTHSETNGSVVLVQIGVGESGVSLSDFAAVEPTLNGEFCFANQLRKGEGGFRCLNLRLTGDPQELRWLKPLLEHLGSHFRFVLLGLRSE